MQLPSRCPSSAVETSEADSTLTADHQASRVRPPSIRGHAGVARVLIVHAVRLSKAHPTLASHASQFAQFGLPMRNSLDFGCAMRYHVEVDKPRSRERS